MLFKPFRPPLLNKPQIPRNHSSQSDVAERPHKKRRISHDEDTKERASQQQQPNYPQVSSSQQSDPSTLKYEKIGSSINREKAAVPSLYFHVLWRKPTSKKNKTWDGDGTLAVVNGYATLRDEKGREMGSTRYKKNPELGYTLSVGGKEVELDSSISREECLPNRPGSAVTAGKPTFRELDAQFRTNVKFNLKPHDEKEEKAIPQKAIPKKTILEKTISTKQTTPAQSQNPTFSSQFKIPLKENTTMSQTYGQKPNPRHDPTLPGALVMKRPRHVPRGQQVVDVVVDPFVCKSLREHQRIGVEFMYECVMGMQPYGGEGAILADEMGLGKTLQVIALLWTLMKQNPIHGFDSVIKKALIVCPVTLIKNWKKEFRKWLGEGRLGVFVLDDSKSRITDFTHGRAYNVMIIGYEKLRSVQTDLQKGAGVDIVIADEGHRLKTAQNKSAQAIKTLNTERRVILSGTPLQNDLSEFYFMVDFVNPGLLGKANAFKKDFENPILKSRQPEATSKEIEKGQAKAEELADLTKTFILRRTKEILAKYLPPKTETVLLCRPTAAQASIYRSVLSSPIFNAVLSSPEASLQLINILKKLCNGPVLLRDKNRDRDDPDEQKTSIISSLLSELPSSQLKYPGTSSKLQVLDAFLYTLHTRTSEKVVIVSHYTTTLDMLQKLLSELSYTWLRLDGTTPSSKRQSLVDKFNRTDASKCFAFLLSAKSGGAGINLIGASRLVLFDVDWNPSTDEQAMARIHRDGQNKPCHIYRLLLQGALDEKIYQRQLTKRSLADSVVDNKTSTSTFTREELKNLFSLNETDKCQTHTLLGCDCPGRGDVPLEGNQSPLEEGFEDIDDVGNDSDSSLPSINALAKASTIDMEAQERRIRDEADTNRNKNRKQHIETLKLFKHVDASWFSGSKKGGMTDEEAEAVLEDDAVLLEMLKEQENRVSYVFTKKFS